MHSITCDQFVANQTGKFSEHIALLDLTAILKTVVSRCLISSGHYGFYRMSTSFH